MRPLSIAACLALSTATFMAIAQDAGSAGQDAEAAATPVAAARAPRGGGDLARGAQLAYTCHGCHGIPGYENAYPNYRVPKIGGQNEAYLVNALTAYADGAREHPTMQAQAQSFSDADIADLAAYLASLQP